MTNHPSRAQYPAAAPVFDGIDQPIEIIGTAKTGAEALAIYRGYFRGTGAKAIRAIKVCPELCDQGPVDGWAPVLDDE